MLFESGCFRKSVIVLVFPSSPGAHASARNAIRTTVAVSRPCVVEPRESRPDLECIEGIVARDDMTPRQENPLSGVIICPNRRRTAVKAKLLGPSFMVRLWRKKSTADDFSFPMKLARRGQHRCRRLRRFSASGTGSTSRDGMRKSTEAQSSSRLRNGTDRFRSLHFLAKFCA